MNNHTLAFIEEHLNHDVQKLALQHHNNSLVDLPFALEQIKGYQVACKKLPTWAGIKQLLYPPHLSLEQCSSEATARYKAQVLAHILEQLKQEGEEKCTNKPTSLVDLTGGFGVDFSFMAPLTHSATYVERNALLCERASHNFPLLRLSHAQVVNDEAEHYVEHMKPCSVIFLDPARRDEKGAKTVQISDCSPDVLRLKSVLLAKCDSVIVKLSPMLDHHLAINQLNQGGAVVSQLHIVSAQNECKELLLVLQKQVNKPLKVCCVNNNEVFSYSETELNVPLKLITTAQEKEADGLQNMFLYEPNASQMKAGCYALLSQKFGVQALAPNSHLFVGSKYDASWQGRVFKITAVCGLNKKEIKKKMAGVERANIAVRNFPMTAQELRKRLKWKEGGHFVFGTTLVSGTRILILGEKLQ